MGLGTGQFSIVAFVKNKETLPHLPREYKGVKVEPIVTGKFVGAGLSYPSTNPSKKVCLCNILLMKAYGPFTC